MEYNEFCDLLEENYNENKEFFEKIVNKSMKSSKSKKDNGTLENKINKVMQKKSKK